MSPIASGQDPLPNYTMVVRAFYPWPLFVTGLGYNIANVGRGSTAAAACWLRRQRFAPMTVKLMKLALPRPTFAML